MAGQQDTGAATVVRRLIMMIKVIMISIFLKWGWGGFQGGAEEVRFAVWGRPAGSRRSDVALIAGTTMKVVELVIAQIAHSWSPEEIHFQHPYLSMSQIHSALAYYWEYKEALDADIRRRTLRVEELRQQSGDSPVAARLRDEGHDEGHVA